MAFPKQFLAATGAVMISIAGMQAAPALAAEAAVPIGIVENPCPPPAPRSADMEAFMETMLDPAPKEAMPPLPSGPEFDAMIAAQAAQKARDWPNLCRYRAENAALAEGAAKVVFMGDSITEGWLPADREFFSHGNVDRGIGGQTSPQMVLRFWQDVVALKPQAVHIMTGTNDLAGNTGPSRLEDYKNNIRAMVDIAQANGIKVILASIPPADRFGWAPDLKPAALIVEMNAWLKQYAAERGLTYVDYHTPLADANGGLRADYGHDGVHPHRAGYAVMRPLAEAAIREALK